MTDTTNTVASVPKFMINLSLLGGAGAVVLIAAHSWSASPGGFDPEVAFAVPNMLGTIVPILFVIGTLFEFCCAIAAALVITLCSRFASSLNPLVVAILAAIAASGISALLSGEAAELSTIPVELIFGSYVFFNLVVVTLLVRLGQEKAAP